MLPKQYSYDPKKAVEKFITVSSNTHSYLPLTTACRFKLPLFLLLKFKKKKLQFQGDFQWLHRSRIRITMLGQNGCLPVSIDMMENEPTQMEVNEYPTELLNKTDKIKFGANVKRILPYLALNEVFIGETMSARVSHLHLKIDDTDYFTKTKSSGLCVSTGTGSSSWLTR